MKSVYSSWLPQCVTWYNARHKRASMAALQRTQSSGARNVSPCQSAVLTMSAVHTICDIHHVCTMSPAFKPFLTVPPNLYCGPQTTPQDCNTTPCPEAGAAQRKGGRSCEIHLVHPPSAMYFRQCFPTWLVAPRPGSTLLEQMQPGSCGAYYAVRGPRPVQGGVIMLGTACTVAAAINPAGHGGQGTALGR